MLMTVTWNNFWILICQIQNNILQYSVLNGEFKNIKKKEGKNILTLTKIMFSKLTLQVTPKESVVKFLVEKSTLTNINL